MQRVVCESLEQLSAVAASFLGRLQASSGGATVVGLSGDLGAGKTAFVKALASHLGIEEHVTSPTFVIQKTYPIPAQSRVTGHESLIHIDAYRLERGEELSKIGWEETLLQPKTLVVVEWPERVADVMPQSMIPISFTWVNDTTRAVTFED
jgi:tRNA threonylcarbamoyladenosine biosynthesis protein TsaE